jgi:hypothetical protein
MKYVVIVCHFAVLLAIGEVVGVAIAWLDFFQGIAMFVGLAALPLAAWLVLAPSFLLALVAGVPVTIAAPAAGTSGCSGA